MDRTKQSSLNSLRVVTALLVVAAYLLGVYSGKCAPTKIDAVTSDGDTTELTVSSDSLTRIPCGTTYIVKK